MLLIGKKYLIRTVTFYHIGVVVAIDDNFVQLSDHLIVHSAGHIRQCLHEGTIKEYEVLPDVPCYIGVAQIIDAYDWNFSTPKKIGWGKNYVPQPIQA